MNSKTGITTRDDAGQPVYGHLEIVRMASGTFWDITLDVDGPLRVARLHFMPDSELVDALCRKALAVHDADACA